MAIEVTFGPMLDALKVQLDARAGMDGVSVYTGWVGEDGGLESIQFDAISTQQDWGLIGNRRLKEDYDVTGFIWVAKAGKGESVIKAARDRASEILNELIAQVRVDFTINGTVEQAIVSRWDADQAVDADGRRACRITFTLNVKADLNA